jgi:hypothetical protein
MIEISAPFFLPVAIWMSLFRWKASLLALNFAAFITTSTPSNEMPHS